MTKFKEREACPGVGVVPTEYDPDLADPSGGSLIAAPCPECGELFWVGEDAPMPNHAAITERQHFTTRKPAKEGVQVLRPKPVTMAAGAKDAATG